MLLQLILLAAAVSAQSPMYLQAPVPIAAPPIARLDCIEACMPSCLPSCIRQKGQYPTPASPGAAPLYQPYAVPQQPSSIYNPYLPVVQQPAVAQVVPALPLPASVVVPQVATPVAQIYQPYAPAASAQANCAPACMPQCQTVCLEQQTYIPVALAPAPVPAPAPTTCVAACMPQCQSVCLEQQVLAPAAASAASSSCAPACMPQCQPVCLEQQVAAAPAQPTCIPACMPQCQPVCIEPVPPPPPQMEPVTVVVPTEAPPSQCIPRDDGTSNAAAGVAPYSLADTAANNDCHYRSSHLLKTVCR
ncbi:unnamed protein product [Caenorhabditis auriculariae]|uniref:Uncharacterized protein n=1 Tax=Caenorhabditis auriculariae TaxID=2777116 RepID=A0A8S1GNZ4_9PELO|nr:unnamed protein product [Caenorhabditis auriculariae]